MARLRLFAGLREAAGTASVEVPGDTVEEVLAAAVARFGEPFAAGLSRARVWLNGEEAGPTDRVATDDEVALLPPVSGGATRPIRVNRPAADALASILVAVLLILANLTEGDAWWAAAVVGMAGVWVGDVATTVARRGRDIPPAPALLSIVATLVAVHMIGIAGLGLGVAIAVVATLAWGVMSDSSRVLTALSPAMLLAVVASVAVGSLYLTRSSLSGSRAPAVFLAVALTVTIVGFLADRLTRLPLGDPFSLTALAAVAAALVSAAVWDLDLVAFLIAGLAMAVSLVAGRGLGAILRTRRMLLVERPPGLLSGFDGVVLAAAVYLPVLRLVLM